MLSLFNWLGGKVTDILDPFYALFGKGTRQQQLLFENLVHRILNATDENSAELITELRDFLAGARLNKLNFTAVSGKSSLLMQLIDKAVERPVLWECLKSITQSSANATIGWNERVKGKNGVIGPSSLGKLIDLAYEDDSGEGNFGAQEVLTSLINSGILLDWSARTNTQDDTSAIWALVAAVWNGDKWAVPLLQTIIEKFNRNIKWNVKPSFSDEENTPLSLVVQLAVRGNRKYLETILEDEVVFSKLDFKTTIKGVSLIEMLAEKPECKYLAKWILLGAKDIEENHLGPRAKAISQELNRKIKPIAERYWYLKEAWEIKPNANSMLLSLIALKDLEEDLRGIPNKCHKWLVNFAISHRKFDYSPTPANKTCARRNEEALEREFILKSHQLTADLVAEECVKNQEAFKKLERLGQKLDEVKEECKKDISQNIVAALYIVYPHTFIDIEKRQQIARLLKPIEHTQLTEEKIAEKLRTLKIPPQLASLAYLKKQDEELHTALNEGGRANYRDNPYRYIVTTLYAQCRADNQSIAAFKGVEGKIKNPPTQQTARVGKT